MDRAYYNQKAAEAIANPGEKIHIILSTEEDAANIVGAVLMLPYDFTIRTLNGVECVNARSIIGAIYCTSHINNSYLVCEGKRGCLEAMEQGYATGR